MKKIFSLLFFVILCCSFIKAQEVVFPLSSNPVIKEYLKRNAQSPDNANRQSQTSNPKPQTSTDTLSLPFIDDFSKPVGIYPDASLWLDSGAFINSTFCDNPITVGVATLDGIDKNGNPYGGNSTIICDYLTSKPINLSGLTASEAVYFSFYYQPQGLGDEPETGDSLVLQFYGKDTTWVSVWNHDGASDKAFARVNINISDSNYLDSAFQFRFLNYATANGNRDHWNIDYVFLNKNRSNNDSLDGLKDIGYINPPPSLLNEYQSMPWSHYKNYSSPSTLVKPLFVDSIRNIWNPTASIGTSSIIFDSTGNTAIYTFSPTHKSLNSFFNSVTLDSSKFSGSFSFPPDANEHAEFIIKNYCDTIKQQLNRNNDTTYCTQKFDNYYEYDDGSAEAAYGISVAFAKMAYRFDLKMADTLRGIQIYFNPWGKDVHSNLIQICLWDSINVTANYEHLVHKQINKYVINIDSINGFATYVFDTSQYVSGRIYVGLIQNTSDLLGIGVDVNTNTGNNMFINYNNKWYQSGIPASWMIRPFFGKDLRVGIDEQARVNNDFEIYPNPTGRQFTVYGLQFAVNATLDIYNVLEEKVTTRKLENRNSKLETTVDVSNLSNGIYFVKLTDEKSGNSSVKRLIVQH